MNNNLSRFADSKVYFQCPICTKSLDIQGNSLICRHGHCFDISRCKSQYNNVGLGQNNIVVFPTFLFCPNRFQ